MNNRQGVPLPIDKVIDIFDFRIHGFTLVGDQNEDRRMAYERFQAHGVGIERIDLTAFLVEIGLKIGIES